MTSLAEGTGFGVAEASKTVDTRYLAADDAAAGGGPGPILLRPLLALGRNDLDAFCALEGLPAAGPQRTFLD